ncbi:hypothetical protein [Actinoplanes auranticolor]|uniref:Uncharacterized protein n=1 Tax=Actinoplanes auranticolor TaxID=47988 RepID=A0A919VSJ2_9ACTN|nr:hypothetical protein [Actinoplanes auranticolor]GIM74891.1 hypothetical protein Aau02nite_63170 [Actinoplanes auranticolor]
MDAILDASPDTWTDEDADLLGALQLRASLIAGSRPETSATPRSEPGMPLPVYFESTAQRAGWSAGYTIPGHMPEIYYPRVRVKWAKDPIGALAFFPFVLALNAISWSVAVCLHLIRYGTSRMSSGTAVKSGSYIGPAERVVFAGDGIYFYRLNEASCSARKLYNSISSIQYDRQARALKVHQVFSAELSQTEDLIFERSYATIAFVLLQFLCYGVRNAPLSVPDWFPRKAARFGRPIY